MALSLSYKCKLDSRKRISLGKLCSQLEWSENSNLVQTIVKRKGKMVVIIEVVE